MSFSVPEWDSTRREHTADTGHQDTAVEGLGDVVVGTGFQSENDVDRVVARGQHDDRHRQFLTNASAQADSVQVGKHHVEDGDIRLGVDRHIHSGQPSRCGDHPKPVAFEIQLRCFADDSVVFDQQNQRIGHRPSLSWERNTLKPFTGPLVCSRRLTELRNAGVFAQVDHDRQSSG